LGQQPRLRAAQAASEAIQAGLTRAALERKRQESPLLSSKHPAYSQKVGGGGPPTRRASRAQMASPYGRPASRPEPGFGAHGSELSAGSPSAREKASFLISPRKCNFKADLRAKAAAGCALGKLGYTKILLASPRGRGGHGLAQRKFAHAGNTGTSGNAGNPLCVDAPTQSGSAPPTPPHPAPPPPHPHPLPAPPPPGRWGTSHPVPG